MPPGPVAVGISERANVNRFRPAVNRVRTRIIGARKNFLRLDHFDDLWFPRIGLRIDDVNPRGPESRHNQVTPFDVRMRRVRAQRRTARVPPEMMQLITKLWHLHLADALAVRGRLRINIHNQQCVIQFAAGRIQRGDKRVFFRRSLHCQSWRRIKRGIWF